MSDSVIEVLSQGLVASEGANPRLAWAVANVLVQEAQQRPVVVVMDDAHLTQPQGPVRVLLDALLETDCGILVLCAVCDEVMAVDTERRAWLEAHVRRGGDRWLPVEPLYGQAWSAWLAYVGLSETTAAEIHELCAGNPGFALATLRSWSESGRIVAGADGLALLNGELPDVADALYRQAEVYVQEALKRAPPVGGIHAERAAAIGMSVDDEVWDETCDDPVHGRVSEAGLQMREALTGALLDAGLVRERATGWAFSQPMTRHALARAAQQAGRWPGHHLAVAQVLERGELTAERRVHIARHLLQAGSSEAAVDCAIEAMVSTYGAQPIDPLAFSTLQRAMRQADLTSSDLRWARLWTFQAGLWRRYGQWDEAEASASRARNLAETAGDVGAWAQASEELGRVAETSGDHEGALNAYKKGVSRLLRAGHKGRGLARLLYRMARLGRQRFELDDAERWGSQGLAVLVRSPDGDPQSSGVVDASADRVLEALLQGELAHVVALRGDPGEALEALAAARQSIETKAMAIAPLAALEVHEGDVRRDQGQWDAAQLRYAAAAQRRQDAGLPPAGATMRLALCAVQRQDYAEAQAAADRVLEVTVDAVYAAWAALCRGAVDAVDGNADALRQRGRAAMDVLQGALVRSVALADLATRVAELAADRGFRHTATDLWLFARDQVVMLGDRARTTQIDKSLEGLGSWSAPTDPNASELPDPPPLIEPL